MVLTRLIDSISGKMAFFPPTPPSYTLRPHPSSNDALCITPSQPGLPGVPRAQVLQLPVGKKSDKIVAVLIPAPNVPASFSSAANNLPRPILLHSHGNAVDLGEMLPFYDSLSRLLKCDVIAYDYRGYGRSTGAPAASSTLEDISAVLACVLQTFGRRPEDVVLYGQSVGTGPTSWLAAANPKLAGVVLHAPFLSGLRVIRPTLKRWPAWADIFPNFKHVPKISCRTLILHGTEDEVIDVAHGKELYSMVANPSEPLWAEGRGHQDVEMHPSFIPTLRRFLKECFGDSYARNFPPGAGAL